MYDWPEVRSETDRLWAQIRARFMDAGIDAPARLVRRNGDLPAVPGGICDIQGNVIAADPATLPPDELDIPVLWRHPALLFGQTCWGPMQVMGLAEHVVVVGQPDYSDVEGGQGVSYSSAVIMRGKGHVSPSGDGKATLPLDEMMGLRLAFNAKDSMSGFLALSRDLKSVGSGVDLFCELIETGSHRESALAVAKSSADIAAIDSRSWDLFKRFEPQATRLLQVVGWTSLCKGLPYIRSQHLPERICRLYPEF